MAITSFYRKYLEEDVMEETKPVQPARISVVERALRLVLDNEPSSEEKIAVAMERIYHQGLADARQKQYIITYDPSMRYKSKQVGSLLLITTDSPHLILEKDQIPPPKPVQELIIINMRRFSIDCIGADYKHYRVLNKPNWVKQ